VTKELLIASSPHETKVALLEDDQLVEVYFQRDTDVGLVGGIYKGRVNRVLPGMQSAFVNIGLERDAFLYVSDFFEDSEEYDRVFTEAENRVAKLTESGGADAGTLTSEPLASESKVEASALTSTEPAALEPVPPTVMEAASAVPEEIAPAENSGLATPPRAGSTPSEPRPREFSGGRHRRRGRRFREFRYGSRRESVRQADERRDQTPSHGLELLPGESLAKYAHASAEKAPGVQAPIPKQGGEAPSDSAPPVGIEPLSGNRSSILTSG
jgi:Ribonuclease G/E